MASSITVSSVLDWSPEKFNGFKLRRLIVDAGTKALRNIFQQCHRGKSIQSVLATEKHRLLPLCKGTKGKKGQKKIIDKTQWDKLYPTAPKIADINTFDITLLSIVLRNTCSLTAPAGTGWDKEPNAGDNSDEANIVRIKLFRNDLHAHIHETGISTDDFEHYWNKISPVLVSLGIDKKEIDKLKDEECGKEEVERVMNEWNTSIKDDLERIEVTQMQHLQISSETQKEIEELEKGQKQMKRCLTDIHKHIKQKRCKSSEGRQIEQNRFRTKLTSDTNSKKSDEVLRKLVRCDFTAERKFWCDSFVQGTREWVFQQVNEWFNDNTSENRAFVITGEAGMGKSVIAAVVCKKMHEQLAGCHFINYKNDHYNNPNILLQSLALQISNVLPEYKKNLVDNLSRNLGSKNVNEMNAESLFTILLKQPFAYVNNVSKSFLFVIDGIDESCDSEARNELVDLIAEHLHKLPNFIRFLVTTRPQKNIIDKMKPLNPLYLEKYDQNNQNDLRIFFKTKLPSLVKTPSGQSLIEELMSKSDGLMLYAFYIFDLYKKEGNHENFPTSLNGVFERYFKRLEKECKTTLNINEDKFLLFLSAMVTSREPLPLDFVLSIFGVEKGTASEKRNAVKIMNCISVLFTTTDDHVNVFHKSVKDWLVSVKHHFYQIDEKHGHVVLAKHSAECFDNLLHGSTDLDPSKLTNANKYALRNGFFHMIEDDDNFVSYLNKYLMNLEVICRCFSSHEHKYLFVHKITNMLKRKHESRVAADLEKLIDIIDYVDRVDVFQQYGCYIFLHQLMFDKGRNSNIGSEALKLLMRFYPKMPSFENVYDNTDLDGEELFTEEEEHLCSADVHSNLNYVVLCFQSYVIKLISLKPLAVIWTKVFREDEICPYAIAFHPHKDVILPGRLDKVLSLTADESGHSSPFFFRGIYFFTCCCFSNDNTIMITGNNLYKDLDIWDLDSGLHTRRIELIAPASSLSFSPSGDYLAVLTVTDDGNLAFSVFNVRNNYELRPRIVVEDKEPFTQFHDNFPLLKGYKSDSWFVSSTGLLFVFDLKGVGLTFLSPDVKLIAPLSTKLIETLGNTITSQIMQKSDYLHFLGLLSRNSSDVNEVHKILHDELQVMIYAKSVSLESAKITPGNISYDGEFLYQHLQSSRELRILNRNTSTGWISMREDVPNIIAFAVVKNGIFLVTVEKNIEMWNVEMSECLMKSELLEAMKCCESVSDYLVAYVGETQVSFIDTRTLQVVSTTSLSENQDVLASSSRCDVVVKNFQKDEYLIMRDSKIIYSLNDAKYVELAKFSPNATKLVLYINRYNEELYTCYEISESFSKIRDVPAIGQTKTICFIDDDYFISVISKAHTDFHCRSDLIQLTCLSTGEITITPTGWRTTSVFYSRETQTLIANAYNCAFTQFHLHWPTYESVRS